MKRKNISSMTPEQAMDELTMLELKSLLQKARKAQQKAAEMEAAVFRALDNMCIDIDVPTNAENASTLEEAVSCYINYGEFGLRNLITEIKTQYIKENAK